MKNFSKNVWKVFLLLMLAVGLITPALAKEISLPSKANQLEQDEVEIGQKELEENLTQLKEDIKSAGIEVDFTLNEHMEVIKTDDGEIILTGISDDEDVFHRYETHRVDGNLRSLPIPIKADEQKEEDERLNDLIHNFSPKTRSAVNYANISGSSVVENYGFTHGAPDGTIRTARNAFYVYVKKGETLQITMHSPTRRSTSKNEEAAFLVRQDNSVVKKEVMRGPALDKAKEGAVFSETSNKDQFYGFYTDDITDTGVSYNLNIQVGKNGGKHQKGRTFAESWTYYQLGTRKKEDNRTVIGFSTTLYHLLPTGELYKQTLSDHNGFHFDIESNSAGVIDRNDPYCEPVYSSTPNYEFSNKYEVVMRDDRCKGRIARNNLFLEYPSDELPKEAQLPGNLRKFIRPRVEEHIPAITEVHYNKAKPHKHGGSLVFSTKNHEGNAQVIIEADDNGDNNFKEVRRYRPSIERNETGKIEWDGKDAKGKEVSVSSHIRVRVVIDRTGEVHFVVNDLEMNRGGIKVTALENLSGVQSSVLHYDDSDTKKLPIDWSRVNPRFKGGLSQLNGFDSVKNWDYHAWNFLKGYGTSEKDVTRAYRLPSYPGMIGKPHTQDDSLGDGNYMHEWTWDKNYKGVRKETKVGTIDLIYGSLVVADENKNDFAETDETLSYSGSFHNLGTTRKDNPSILIDLSDEKIDENSFKNAYAKVDGKDVLVSSKLVDISGRPHLELELNYDFTYNDVIDYGFDIKPKGYMQLGDKQIDLQASIAGGLGLTTPKIVDGLPATANGEPSEKTSIKPGGPKLEIKKSGKFNSDVKHSDHIDYVIKVRNISDFTAKNVVIEDKLDSPYLRDATVLNLKASKKEGLEIKSEKPLAVKLDELKPQEEIEVTFRLSLRVGYGGDKIINTAKVDYNGKTESSRSEEDLPKSQPEVIKSMIDMGDKNGVISPGEPIRFVFEIKASPERALFEPRIIDELADERFDGIKNLRINTDESSPVRMNGISDSKIDVILQPIAPGETGVLVVDGVMSPKMQVGEDKMILNEAKHSYSNAEGGEVETMIEADQPDIDLEKSVSAGRVIDEYQTIHPSMLYEYRISVKNNSKAIAYDLEISDEFKDDFFKDAIEIVETKVENESQELKIKAINDNSIILEEMPAGASFDFVIKAKMKDLDKISLRNKGQEINPSETHLVRNTAQARTPEFDGVRQVDVNAVDKEGNEDTRVEVIFPFLKQEKYVETIKADSKEGLFGAGEQYKWTIKTDNIGKHRMENLVVKEEALDFFDYVDVDKIIVDGKEVDTSLRQYELPVIKANESKLVEIIASVKDIDNVKLPSVLENRASLEFADIKRESKVELTKGHPRASIKKTTDSSYAAAGDSINYEIKVKNEGDVLLKNIKLKDELTYPSIKPEEITNYIKSVEKNRGGQTKDLDISYFMGGSYVIKELKPAEEVVFNVEVKLPSNFRASSKHSLDNLASIEVEEIKEESLSSLPVKEAEVYAIKEVSDDVDKNDNIDGFAEAGEYLKYTISVFNDADVAAKNIKIIDDLDDKDLQIAEIFDESFNPINKASFEIPELKAKSSQDIIFYVKLDEKLPKENHHIINQADVYVGNGDVSKTNKAVIEIIRPELELIKDVSVKHQGEENYHNIAVSNKVLEYRFKMSNNSITRINNPVLYDELKDESLKNAEIIRVYTMDGKELGTDIRGGIELEPIEPFDSNEVVMEVKLNEISEGAELIENRAYLKSKNAELVESYDSLGNEITSIKIGKYDVVGETSVTDDLPGNIVNDKVSPSDLIKHTIKFTNNSDIALDNVYLEDIFLDDKFEHFELEEAYGYVLDEESEIVRYFEVVEDGLINKRAYVGLVEPGYQVVLEVFHRAPEDLSVFDEYEDNLLRLSAKLEADNIAPTTSRDVDGGPESIIEFEKAQPAAAKIETYAKGATYIFAISFIVSASAFWLYRKRKKRV